jgi:copper chaperone NosL
MTLKTSLDRFYAFLDRPLFGAARIALIALVIPLALTFTQPLWRIELHAPQYPDGLWMEIYAHKLDAGNEGQHVQEINTLNHYIGMHKIDRAELSDLDWLPFGIGLLIVIALRCAVIGNVRSLIDLAVTSGYITLFAFGRFIYKLYVFGHNLDPAAPVKVPAFTPAIVGTRQIANFTETSTPQLGALLLGVFVIGVIGVLGWHLIAGRLAAARDDRATPVTPP